MAQYDAAGHHEKVLWLSTGVLEKPSNIICPTVKNINENITPFFQFVLERLFIQLHDRYSYVFLHQNFK